MSFNYQPKKSRKNRKINIKNLIILIFVILALIALAIFGFKFGAKLISSIFKDPYAQYQVYNEESKLFGKQQHDSIENEEELYYLSFYYPEFKEDYLNQAIEQYRSEHIKTNLSQEDMIYVTVDYDCEQLYDKYTTLTFHQKVFDKDNNEIKNESVSYNFDAITKAQMNENDVLRRNYIKHLQSLDLKLDKALLKRGELSQFILNKDSVTFYFNKDVNQNITLKYSDHKDYIALADKNIPSLYMQDRVVPAPQPEVDPNKKMIAFTFDDGPAGDNTYAIMNEFEKYNGRATFFMLGQNVPYFSEVVKDVYKRGHEVATHSYTHDMGIAATGTFSAEQVSAELYDTCDEIYKLTGYEPKYFRPPYGAINDNVLNECGMDIIKWDIDTLDWSNHNPTEMTNIIVENAKVGYVVVLMHDIHNETVDGVRQSLAQLNAMGYQFVTMETLLQHEKEYLTNFYEDPLSNVVIEGNKGV